MSNLLSSYNGFIIVYNGIYYDLQITKISFLSYASYIVLIIYCILLYTSEVYFQYVAHLYSWSIKEYKGSERRSVREQRLTIRSNRAYSVSIWSLKRLICYNISNRVYIWKIHMIHFFLFSKYSNLLTILVIIRIF